ncbi:hypothetical protein QVD17_28690 [Tagetes erecta]|uniref:HAT C-terminal dimerisation domain-containing protein n=1 Tax=Tagetes erecta TaxID=13708 RepID=A0AAD8KFH6_TARER|nr:hypothetical protein QVD17_28690 [Tagetes erecta]
MPAASTSSKGLSDMDTTNVQQLSSDESREDKRNESTGDKRKAKGVAKNETEQKKAKKGDSNYSKELGTCVPRHADWHYARELSKVLELFKRKTKNASATTKVVANQFFNDSMHIDRHLRSLMLLKEKDIVSFKMGGTMQQKYDKYWRQDQKFNKLLYFATILDPRWKTGVIAFGYKEIFTAEKKEKETEDDIIQKVSILVKSILGELEIVFEHYVRNSEEPSSSNVKQKNIEKYSEEDDEDNEFLSDFKSDCGASVIETKSELQRYLDDNEEPGYRGFDILQWWKSSSSKYPILAKMAKDIFAIQISSVASEAAFSMAGRVVETYRSSLSPAIVEALVCARDWLCKSSKDINVEEDWTQFDEIGALTSNIQSTLDIAGT